MRSPAEQNQDPTAPLPLCGLVVVASGQDRDVAGRPVEQSQHPRVLEQAVGRIDQEQVDIVLGRQPGRVSSRGE